MLYTLKSPLILPLTLFVTCTLYMGVTTAAGSTPKVEAETPLQIYEIAIKNDPSMGIANAEYLAKEENKSLARGGLYPELDLTAEVARNREDVDTSGIGTSGTTNFDSHKTQLELKQSLYNKNKFSKIDIADAEYKVAETEHKIALQEIIMSVATTYFDVLTAQDNLDFAKAENLALSKQLEIIKQRYHAGKSTKTDLLEVQASFDLSYAEVILTEDDYKDALEGLTQLTGEEHSQVAKLSDTFFPAKLEPANLEHWVETAKKNNLQILAERHSIQSHKFEIEQQRSGHYPSLDLVARYSIEETGGRFGDSNIDDQTIKLELDIPLYKGGQVNSRIREAHLRLNESKFRLLKTQRNVIRKTQKAYRAVINSLNRVKALDQAVGSAQAALTSITKAYKIGSRTTADVLDSQRDLFKTQRDYSADRYNYVLNYLQIKNIAGLLTKDDLVTIDLWFK